jgi:hypothetical protein
MAVAVLLGLLIGAALGALGGGGSVLAVPVLVHIAGQSPSAATATSLVAVAAAAAVGSVNHARAGNVRWGAAVAFVAVGVAGSWAGSAVNEQIDGDALMLGFSVLVLVAAHRMLTACPTCTKVGEEAAVEADVLVHDHVGAEPASHGASAPAPGAGLAGGATAPADVVGDVAARTGVELPSWADPTAVAAPARWRSIEPAAVAKVVVAGLGVGFLTGLFGVGGGFVIVPALTLALGLNMRQAIGTSLVVIVGNSLVALGFRGAGAVEWDVALPFTATMLVGSFLGSRFGAKLPPRQSLTAFAVLLVAVALATGIAAAVAIWS